MGYWTNGTDKPAVYKSHTNDWVDVPGAQLPSPGDDLTAPPKKPPTWEHSARFPNEGQLSAALRRLDQRRSLQITGPFAEKINFASCYTCSW